MIKEKGEGGVKKANYISRVGNVTSIITPSVTHHIGYNNHFLPQGPLDIKGASQAIFVEGGLLPYPNTAEEFMKAFYIKPQSDALEFAYKNNIPIYATDCGISFPVVIVENFTPAVELFGAMYLWEKLEKSALASNNVSRRRFLRYTGLGLAVFAALPIIGSVGRILSVASSTASSESTEFSKFSQNIHPEYKIFTLRLRNLIMAQKLKYVTSRYNLLETYSVLGSDHVAIEDYLLVSKQERMDTLWKIQPALQFITIPETVYRINKYEVLEGSWTLTQTLEEPNLKALVT